MIEKATKKKQKLKLLIEGASGSGKTMSALKLAKGLVGENGKIVVLDTENGSASLYANKFDFYTTELKPPFSPNNYILKIEEVEKFKADLLIIDSMSMIWSGEGGCLDIQTGLGGRFTDWAKVTPQYEKFMNKILQSNMHIICTARTKSDWAIEINEKGKPSPQKIGLKTEARDGTDYTFTTVFRLNQNHYASSSKDRTGLFDNLNSILDEKIGEQLLAWLQDGDVQSVQATDQVTDQVKTNVDKHLEQNTKNSDQASVQVSDQASDQAKTKTTKKTKTVEEPKSITTDEIMKTNDDDILNLFKEKCIEAGLEKSEIKFFGKRNGINPKDVNSILEFLKKYDLKAKVFDFKNPSEIIDEDEIPFK